MDSTNLLTSLGLFVLISYGLIRILQFYGIGVSSYGTYIAFYSFLLLSVFVLPNNYP